MTVLRRLSSSAQGLYGLIVVAVILVTALVSLFWTPFDPRATDVASRWLPPAWPHLLGTDLTGRDILSLIMAGSRTTVLVAAGAGIVATVIGVALGALGAGVQQPAHPFDLAVERGVAGGRPLRATALLVAPVRGDAEL